MQMKPYMHTRKHFSRMRTNWHVTVSPYWCLVWMEVGLVIGLEGVGGSVPPLWSDPTLTRHQPLIVNRMTDMCKNITFPA